MKRRELLWQSNIQVSTTARLSDHLIAAFGAGHTRGNWSGTNAGGLDWAAVKLRSEPLLL